MEKSQIIHSTFVIERKYPTSPQRVFDAFADPEKKRRWFFEGDSHQLESHEMDFKVGGQERAQLVVGPGTPVSGMTFVNETQYENIVPGRRIVTAYRMIIGGNCISVALATIELLPTDQGTELILTHQGAYFEGADGPEIRKEGWEQLLEELRNELAR